MAIQVRSNSRYPLRIETSEVPYEITGTAPPKDGPAELSGDSVLHLKTARDLELIFADGVLTLRYLREPHA